MLAVLGLFNALHPSEVTALLRKRAGVQGGVGPYAMTPPLRTILAVSALATTATASTFSLLSRNSRSVPLPPSDPLFASSSFRNYNPDKNPTTRDLCVRRVPLGRIRAELLEGEGRLDEAFCQGVWGGWGRVGFAFADVECVGSVSG
ncbi:hypothetical protein B0A49_03050 [Cryomyces minteri]|uniref:Uncharacterized protein n=1 Tax=Cryomyces minteri TaxID=331657 RepID=A0A4V5NH41_9PEZI|nr:hypothetical protein B0A49_03050 [Cryomyces minteri]